MANFQENIIAFQGKFSSLSEFSIKKLENIGVYIAIRSTVAAGCGEGPGNRVVPRAIRRPAGARRRRRSLRSRARAAQRSSSAWRTRWTRRCCHHKQALGNMPGNQAVVGLIVCLQRGGEDGASAFGVLRVGLCEAGGVGAVAEDDIHAAAGLEQDLLREQASRRGGGGLRLRLRLQEVAQLPEVSGGADRRLAL